MYQKNTKLSILIEGDGSEIFEFGLPHPHSYKRFGSKYELEYIINGFFSTNHSLAYLNDILARFTLSMRVIRSDISQSSKEGIELSLFRGLKSVKRANDYERGDRGEDNVFWSIKLYTEDLIREYGEGETVAYSLLESFAFERFIERAKDKSTLKAKCRSIWNWYDARGWTIPKRKRKGKMSRQEGAEKARKILVEETKKKVEKAIQGLLFMQEKVNIANVARDAKVSRDTAKKYLIELGYIKGEKK